MGLHEFKGGVGTHFAAYNAQEIVFHPYSVDSPYLIAFHYETQTACKAAGDLLLPMETYSDGDII